MSQFVKFTKVNGDDREVVAHVDKTQVLYIAEAGARTIINLRGGDFLYVTDSPDTVLAKLEG